MEFGGFTAQVFWADVETSSSLRILINQSPLMGCKQQGVVSCFFTLFRVKCFNFWHHLLGPWAFPSNTLPKTNIAPENKPSKKESSGAGFLPSLNLDAVVYRFLSNPSFHSGFLDLQM